MKVVIRILFLTSVAFFSRYSNLFAQNPKNLNQAIEYFEEKWTAKELNDFKNMPEADATVSLHHSVGMWIRNTWIRGSSDTALGYYFRSIGIFNPDDMSAIILTSLHRKLNNKNIDLDSQVKIYQDYWKTIHECKTRVRALAISNFHKINIGEQVKIFMPVGTVGGEPNAFYYDCPSLEWVFNKDIDLDVEGVVVNKWSKNDSSNCFVAIKIQNMNFPKTTILMKHKYPGDTCTFQLGFIKFDKKSQLNK